MPGQMPSQVGQPKPPSFEQDFAMGKTTQPSFTEENFPNAQVVGFTEENLPNADVIDFAKGVTESASDEALSESTKHFQSPEAIQTLLAKSELDAGDQGGFTDSLTSSEKVALGIMAIMPLLGGAIGGEDGALIGAGAAGSGLTAFGTVKFKEQQRQAKNQAAEAKFQRTEQGRDKRAGIKAAATTKSQTLALEKEKRVRRQALARDWRKDDIRKSYDGVRAADGKLQRALKGTDGVSDLVSIIAFHKGLDPGSVVRDSEVVMVQRSQGIKGRMENILGAATGKTLSRAAKAQMSKLSKEFVAIHAELARNRANDFRTEAESFDIEPDFVVPPAFFNSLGPGPAPGPGAGPGAGQGQGQLPGQGKKGVSRIRRQRDSNGNFVTE